MIPSFFINALHAYMEINYMKEKTSNDQELGEKVRKFLDYTNTKLIQGHPGIELDEPINKTDDNN